MFVEAVASMVDKQHKRLITFERSVSKRPNGRIYMDSHQNSRGQSLASVYSVRAFPHAPVSTPVKPGELTASLDPAKWNVKTMQERIEKVGDLVGGFLEEAAASGKAAGTLKPRTLEPQTRYCIPALKPAPIQNGTSAR